MMPKGALPLISGLIFLFFFTPGYGEEYNFGPGLTALSLLTATFMPSLTHYMLGKIVVSKGHKFAIVKLYRLNLISSISGMLIIVAFVFEIYYMRLPVLVNKVFQSIKLNNLKLLTSAMPLIIAIMVDRITSYKLERRVREPAQSIGKFIRLNLKLILFPALPFVASLLISDIIDNLPLKVRIFFVSHFYLYWIIMLFIIILTVIKAPFFMRRIWPSIPLNDGYIRNRIEAFARRQNIKYRDILIWNVHDDRTANAGVTGLTSRSRYIFITKALLDNFDIDEIETIIAHEFGHIKYKHMLVYLVLSGVYMLFYASVYTRISAMLEGIKLNNILSSLIWAISTLIAFLFYFILIFRYVSRSFERQADIYAVSVTGKADSFKSALIKLASINYIPSSTPRFAELLKTHPSVPHRIQVIDKVVQGKLNADKYLQPVFRVSRGLGIAVVVMLIALLIDKDSIYSPEEIYYEIGRQYASEGMIDEAIEQFRKAEERSPHMYDALYALGILYEQKGDLEGALSEFKKILEVDPENKYARTKLEQITKKMQDKG